MALATPSRSCEVQAEQDDQYTEASENPGASRHVALHGAGGRRVTARAAQFFFSKSKSYVIMM